MSKFVTPFPFPLDEIKSQLPKGSFFECVKWNKEKAQVEVYWEHDAYRTGRDHAIDFPIESLAAGSLPEGIEVPKFLQKLIPRLPEGVTEVPPPDEPEGNINLGCSDPIDHPDGCSCKELKKIPPAEPQGALASGGTPPESRQVRTGEGDNVPKKPAKAKGKAN